MSISLSGTPQPPPVCTDPPHEWEIVGMHDENPDTGKRNGRATLGTCRKCGQERMYDSGEVQHTKGEIFLLNTNRNTE